MAIVAMLRSPGKAVDKYPSSLNRIHDAKFLNFDCYFDICQGVDVEQKINLGYL